MFMSFHILNYKYVDVITFWNSKVKGGGMGLLLFLDIKYMNNKGFSLIEVLVAVLIITTFLLCFVLPFTGVNIPTGSGNQVGYISAVEKTGVIWKTGRVYIKPTLESTQEDIYCVIDEDVYYALKEKSLTSEKVNVQHNSVFIAGVSKCAGEGAIINSLEVVTNL